MKTTVSLFLFVTILLLGSGCKTTNLATEKVSHEQAIQALEQHSFKIVIEKSTTKALPEDVRSNDSHPTATSACKAMRFLTTSHPKI